METLLLTLLMVAVFAVIAQSNKAVAVPVMPDATVETASTRAEFVRTVTVTVDHPSQLADAIDRVRRDSTRALFGPNYIVGEPHITPDGMTAHISLFR